MMKRIVLLAAAACVLAGTTEQVEAAGNPIVLVSTTKGDIKIELDQEKAPKTVANFLAYVKEKHYDGTIFHRVIPDFMIQAGGMDKNMNERSTKEPVQNEADNGLKNVAGSVAMARTNDPHSATAQFFINVKDNTFLDHRSKTPSGYGYTVFGKVIDGMDVVKKIEKVKTTTRSPHQNVPDEPVIIKSIRLVE
jgi:peptidyl-prolyl cis-trans isomerase B (cyclophilin B)